MGSFRAGTKMALQQGAKNIYRKHYGLVARVCPKHRLLELRFSKKGGVRFGLS